MCVNFEVQEATLLKLKETLLLVAYFLELLLDIEKSLLMQVSPKWGRQFERHQVMVTRKESKLNF